MGVDDLICYSDSLLSINLITVDFLKFHIYVVLLQDIKVLLQDIKDLFGNRNFTLHHTLREGNQCADFLTKMGASSEVVFTVYHSPLAELMSLIRNDPKGTCFPRAWFLSSVSFLSFYALFFCFVIFASVTKKKSYIHKTKN